METFIFSRSRAELRCALPFANRIMEESNPQVSFVLVTQIASSRSILQLLTTNTAFLEPATTDDTTIGQYLFPQVQSAT
jgi:hypothetical protein